MYINIKEQVVVEWIGKYLLQIKPRPEVARVLLLSPEVYRVLEITLPYNNGKWQCTQKSEDGLVSVSLGCEGSIMSPDYLYRLTGEQPRWWWKSRQIEEIGEIWADEIGELPQSANICLELMADEEKPSLGFWRRFWRWFK